MATEQVDESQRDLPAPSMMNTLAVMNILWSAAFTLEARVGAQGIIARVGRADPHADSLLRLEYLVSVVETCEAATIACVMGLMMIDHASSISGRPLELDPITEERVIAIARAAREYFLQCCALTNSPDPYHGRVMRLPVEEVREAINDAREIVAQFAPLRRRFRDHPSALARDDVQGRPAIGEWLGRVAQYLNDRPEWASEIRGVYALLNVAAVAGWGEGPSPDITILSVWRKMVDRLPTNREHRGEDVVRAAMHALGHRPDVFVAGDRQKKGRVERGKYLMRKRGRPDEVGAFRAEIRKGVQAAGGVVNSHAAKAIGITVVVLRELIAGDPVLAQEYPAVPVRSESTNLGAPTPTVK